MNEASYFNITSEPLHQWFSSPYRLTIKQYKYMNVEAQGCHNKEN